MVKKALAIAVLVCGDDVLTAPVARRIEAFTGAGRRRKWSPEAKARIVTESSALSACDMAGLPGNSRRALTSHLLRTDGHARKRSIRLIYQSGNPS